MTPCGQCLYLATARVTYLGGRLADAYRALLGRCDHCEHERVREGRYMCRTCTPLPYTEDERARAVERCYRGMSR